MVEVSALSLWQWFDTLRRQYGWVYTICSKLSPINVLFSVLGSNYRNYKTDFDVPASTWLTSPPHT